MMNPAAIRQLNARKFSSLLHKRRGGGGAWYVYDDDDYFYTEKDRLEKH